MGTRTKALLYGVGFLLGVELALRLVPAPVPAVPRHLLTDRENVCFVLGTSRTLRGVVPRVIEGVLRQHGLRRPWVANVSAKGITTVGLQRLYDEEIRPTAGFVTGPAVVAIEVRGSGLNDSYVTPAERTYLSSQLTAATSLADGLRILRAGGADGLARSLLGRLALARARPLLGGAIRSASDPPAGGSDSDGERLPAWAMGEKGWLPFHEPRPADLKERSNREKYRGRLLRDYRLGGLQTDALARLVRRVRSDGLHPVLFVMPVTELQRAFYGQGDYAAFRALLPDVAHREGVRVVDLDSSHALELTSFHDTHHLTPLAAREFSRRFASEVLLPELEPDRMAVMRAGDGRRPRVSPGR